MTLGPSLHHSRLEKNSTTRSIRSMFNRVSSKLLLLLSVRKSLFLHIAQNDSNSNFGEQYDKVSKQVICIPVSIRPYLLCVGYDSLGGFVRLCFYPSRFYICSKTLVFGACRE